MKAAIKPSRQNMARPYKKRNWKKYALHLLPLPAFLIYFLFVLYPIFSAFVYSFFDWDGLVRGAFVGLKNFVDLFARKPFNVMFWNGFRHNVLYFVIEMIVQNGFAFLLAYLLFTKLKGAGFFKAVFFFPRLLSVIVVGFLWKLILNPNFGALNRLLGIVGLEEWAKPWLGDPKTALIAIILINCWFGLGFSMLIFLAGLQAIPREILEAARLDGVKGLRMIRSILLPMMFPSIMIITVFTFTQAFEAFELVYAMQGSDGGPAFSTDTLAVYFYRLAFASANASEIGLGSALAVVLFLFISALSALFLYLTRKKTVEG